MCNYFFRLILTISIIANGSRGFRILGLFPTPIKSHNIFFGKLMAELAQKGHEVHVVSHYPPNPPILNYHAININGSLPSSISKISLDSRLNRGMLGTVMYIFNTCGHSICENIFRHPDIINLNNSKLQFDAVIVEVHGTDCLLGFAHHFNAPIIGISGTDLLPWAAARMGNAENPSHIPNYFVATARKMNIFEKFVVIGATFFSRFGYYILSTMSSEMKAKAFFGKSIPHLDSMAHNTSILLLNSHVSVNDPLPMVPGIIEVGGLHIEPPKPLPSRLNEIIASSKKGVIYFSMGTVIDINTFPVEILNEILAAFTEMPENIIISGVLKDVSVPKNVFMLPWVPQLDLLCHPQLKVFITHGGSMSLQEAAYCATPILGLPVFPNLERNTNMYVSRGGGLSIYFEDITMNGLIEAMNDLRSNTTYKEGAKKISKMFKDRPMTPLDTAIYWTEYILKFGGGEHLRARSAELMWFEYYLLDCVVFGIALEVLASFILYIFYYFKSRKDKQAVDNETDKKLEKDKDQ